MANICRVYAGPVAAALYVLSKSLGLTNTRRSSSRYGSRRLARPFTGDATGIILAAAITATLGLPVWLDLISEYALGFGFGLLIFQALFMRDMLGGSYPATVERSFIPE